MCSSFSFLYDSYACFCDADCFFFKWKGKQLNFTGSFRNRSVAQKIKKKRNSVAGLKPRLGTNTLVSFFFSFIPLVLKR